MVQGVFMRVLLSILCLFLPQIAAAKPPQINAISWGGLNYPNSLTPSDKGNAGFDLTSKISVDFNWLIGKGKLIPYLTLYTQRDTLGYVYNTKEKSTLGIALNYKINRSANLSFGVSYAYDYRALVGVGYSGFGLTADYGLYRTWPLKNEQQVILSGWANLRYPGSVSPSDKDNIIGQGRLTLAREHPLWDTKFKGAGFVALGLFKDKEYNDFNNKVQLDFGLQLKRKIKNTNLTLSAKYRIDRRFKSAETYSGVVVGLSWLIIGKPSTGVKKSRNKAKGWLRKLIRIDT